MLRPSFPYIFVNLYLLIFIHTSFFSFISMTSEDRHLLLNIWLNQFDKMSKKNSRQKIRHSSYISWCGCKKSNCCLKWFHKLSIGIVIHDFVCNGIHEEKTNYRSDISIFTEFHSELYYFLNVIKRLLLPSEPLLRHIAHHSFIIHTADGHSWTS